MIDPDASTSRAMVDRSTLIVLEGQKKLFLMPAGSWIRTMVDGVSVQGSCFVDRWMSCVL